MIDRACSTALENSEEAKKAASAVQEFAQLINDPVLDTAGYGMTGLPAHWVQSHDALRSVKDAALRTEEWLEAGSDPEEARELWRLLVRSTNEWQSVDSEYRLLHADALSAYNDWVSANGALTAKPEFKPVSDSVHTYLREVSQFDKEIDEALEKIEALADEVETRAKQGS